MKKETLCRGAYEKLRRLRTTFDRNYRITKLYADYLNLCPDILTAPMVRALTEEGVEETYAIAALLGEIFGLDGERRPEDRRLMRDYLQPSVRILDRQKYGNDPYYRTVKIPDRKMGEWEFRNETYAPYRGIICDDMTAGDDFSEVPPLGFFPEGFSFPAVLEGGNEWMTLTPVDMDTCRNAIARAHGQVVTFGLGLGYFAFMAARKPEVTSVTVVERSPDVIRLFREVLLPQFPQGNKIRIVQDDAFRYAEDTMPGMGFDYAFADTWRDASDGLPMYLRMRRLESRNPGTVFDYWIEGFLLSRLRALVFEDIWAKESADPTHAGTGATGSFDTVVQMLSREGLRQISLTYPLENL